MIHIILTILKIIGIILLVILGLLLLIILSVLFLPLKYNGKIKIDSDNQCIALKGRYFFGLLRFKAEYSNKKLDYYFKILWKDLLSKNKKTSDKTDSDNHNNIDDTTEDIFEEEKYENFSKDIIKEDSVIIKEERIKDDNSKNDNDINNIVNGNNDSNDNKNDINVNADKINDISDDAVLNATEKTNDDTKKIGLFTKIKNFVCNIFGKIANIKSTIVSYKEKIVFKIKSFCDKLRNINKKKNEILEFIRQEDTKKFLKLVRHQIFLLIKHLLPYKLKGKITFGMDSPDKTGQTLAILSVIRARYGKKVDICPDFDKKILAIDLKFKGRIRVFNILIILLKVIIQKKLREIIKLIKK